MSYTRSAPKHSDAEWKLYEVEQERYHYRAAYESVTARLRNDHRRAGRGRKKTPMTCDLVSEVCHDLMKRALRCESDPSSDLQTAFDCRAKEQAIQKLLADCRAKEQAIQKLLAVYETACTWSDLRSGCPTEEQSLSLPQTESDLHAAIDAARKGFERIHADTWRKP